MRTGFLLTASLGICVAALTTLLACAPAPTGSVDSKAEIQTGPETAAMPSPLSPVPGLMPAPPQVPDLKTRVWLRYARGACLGSCPQYEVAVQTDGRYTATGFRHVPRVGEFSGQFSAAQLQALQQQLATLQALQKKWPNGQPPCTVQVSDQSEFRIESGAQKLHWSGCEGFADKAALEQAVAAFDARVQEALFDNTR